MSKHDVTLYLLALPAAASEQNDADAGDKAFRDDDGDVHAISAHTGGDRKEVGEGNLQEPETEEIHNGRRYGVASSVECLEHNHAVRVPEVSVADDAQARRGQRHDERVVGE